METDCKLTIEKIVNAQLIYLEYVFDNVRYITRYNKEENTEIVGLVKQPYFISINRMVVDDTITILFKLFNGGEHHSFSSLRNKFGLATKNNEINLDTELKQLAYDEFSKEYKIALKLYKNMKIRNLRNSYIGHLDLDRNPIPIDIENLICLNKKLLSMYYSLLKAFIYFPNLYKPTYRLEKLIDENLMAYHKANNTQLR